MRKGSFGGTIAMLAVLLLAITYATLSFPITSGFGQETSQSVQDLGRLAETNTVAKLHFHNYFPRAGEHSIHQKAYDLGEDGGGVEWNQETIIPEDSPVTPTCSEGTDTLGISYKDRAMKSICMLKINSTEYFRAEYQETQLTDSCSKKDTDYLIDFQAMPPELIEDNDEIPARIAQPTGGGYILPDPLNVTCRDSEGSTRYVGDWGTLSQDFRAEDNRYHLLAMEMNKTVSDLYNEWTGVQETYIGTAKSCGSEPWGDAEEDAVDAAENDIEDYFDNAMDSPNTDGIDMDYSFISTPDYTFAEGTTSDVLNGTSSRVGDASNVGNCNRCRDECPGWMDPYPVNASCGYCDNTWKSEVEIDTGRSTAKISLEDTKYRVPTDIGWRNMEFIVDSYTHFFDKD